MALSRNTRPDRRRQILRLAADDSATLDSPARRRKLKATSEEDVASSHTKRDAGYSQAVRRSCQQRLVQLIPVRRSSLIAVIVIAWGVWAGLMLTHYLLFVRGSQTLRDLPVAHLFRLRSDHGISHWLGTQLWMLTALSAFLIYQLRKHKLDDYRARYRVWLGLVAAALFASLDSSSSVLRLIGYSIDHWTRAEFGYSGFAVVLATFASLIGVLGLRLCNELMEAPVAVGFWLGGLICWGISAFLGTGLVHSPWEPHTLDMVVGGCWLGGILSVWLSSGIYLRQIYIQAQKRFLQRGTLLQPLRIQVPKLRLPQWKRESEDGTEREDGRDQDSSERKSGMSRWKGMFRRKDEDDSSGVSTNRSEREVKKPIRTQQQVMSVHDDEEDDREETQSRSRETQRHSAPGRSSTSLPATEDGKRDSEQTGSKKWFSFGRSKGAPADLDGTGGQHRDKKESQEKNETSRPGKKDIEPLAKVRRDADGSSSRGWWPLGKSKGTTPESSTTRNERKESDDDRDSDDRASETQKTNKPSRGLQSWMGGKKPVAKENAPSSEKGLDAKSKTKSSWFARTPKPEGASKADGDTKSKPAAVDSKPKERSSWFGNRADKVKEPTSEKPKKENAGAKKGLFSFMDSLKLKPPTEGDMRSKPKTVSNSNDSLPSTMPDDGSDPEDRSDLYNRQMSKAERKKQRRDQGPRRAA